MTLVVFIGLAVVWAVVLVPGWVSAFRERSGRQTTMDAFSQQLDALGRGAPKRSVATPPGSRLRTTTRFSDHRRPRSTVPQTSRDAAVRRRDILVLLSVCAVVTLIGWLVSGLVAVAVAHLAFDAALGGYAYLLVQRRKAEAARMGKVHYLPRQPSEAAVETHKLSRRPAN